MKKEKSCGCIIFNRDKDVLLLKMNAGHWSFPKGHVEDGETELDTAYREVTEETGIKCKVIDGFRCINSYSPKVNVVKDVVFYVAESYTTNIKIQLEEVSSADFYSIAVARKLITFNTDLDIFNRAVRFYISYRAKA